VEKVEMQLQDALNELSTTSQDLNISDEKLTEAYQHLEEVLKICEKTLQLAYNF
jgi:hypothetical protein